jgi:hypothetical protein
VERSTPRSGTSVFEDPQPVFTFGADEAGTGELGGTVDSPFAPRDAPAGVTEGGELVGSGTAGETGAAGGERGPSSSTSLIFSDESVVGAEGDDDAADAGGIVLPSPSLASRLLSGPTKPIATSSPSASPAEQPHDDEDADQPADDDGPTTDLVRVPAHRRAGKEAGEASATSRIAGRWARALGAGRTSTQQAPQGGSAGVFDFEAESEPES